MIQDMLALRPGPVVVLVGPPGSGKSTFAATFPRPWVLNLDTYREQVSGDACDQTATADAVAVQDVVLDARLRRGLGCVIDSTNVRRDVRAGLLERARSYGAPVLAVLFTVPLSVCLRRNAARPRPVPEMVVREMHARTPTASLPLLSEGFAGVHVVARGGRAWLDTSPAGAPPR